MTPTEESVVMTVAVSSADTGVAWNTSAEHTNNAAARIRVDFL
jgi:hypothetical protein